MDGYNWPGSFKPFAHQKATAQFIINNPRGFVLNEMGLGKSASALWAIDYLLATKQISRALVVAPLSTLNRVWADELFKVLMHRHSSVFYGSAERRRSLYATGQWEIGVVNFDGVPILADLIMQDVSSGALDMIVIDEASAYRNSRTARWKLMRKLVAQVPRLVLMTGTPCPESPLDVYGLAKLLGVSDAPKFFGAWRDMTMTRVNRYTWVPRPDGYEKAFQLLQPAVRFTKADCLDLPPLVHESREVMLTAEQRAAYRQMQKEMQLQFANDDTPLSAINAADRINKLRQIACGVIKDTKTGEYLLLDHAPRVHVLHELIREAATKVIVVVPFKGIIRALQDELSKVVSVEMINGDVAPHHRDRIVQRFRTEADPHVLLVHPKVMAHGLTLTEAATLVFYGPIYSGEETKQIIERINRPGQRHKMTVVRMGATKLEWNIYAAAARKNLSEDTLLELYRSAAFESVA